MCSSWLDAIGPSGAADTTDPQPCEGLPTGSHACELGHQKVLLRAQTARHLLGNQQASLTLSAWLDPAQNPPDCPMPHKLRGLIRV